MENASKALIIAGAILLAILIIGLGIYIYNQAQNSVADTGMDKMAIRQINGQFEPYLDVELSSVQAKSLIDTINNVKEVSLNTTATGAIKSKGEIETGETYTAEAEYSKGQEGAWDTTSMITKIAITKKGGSTTPSEEPAEPTEP